MAAGKAKNEAWQDDTNHRKFIFTPIFREGKLAKKKSPTTQTITLN
jgi:hypothetical protein